MFGSIRFDKFAAILLAFVGVSVLLRVGLALYYGNEFADIRGGTFDQISYDELARRVVAGHGFSFGQDWWPYARANEPTAFWSFPYTLFLAAVYSVFGASPLVARVIQAVAVGVGIPVVTYWLGSQVFSKKVGLVAAAISAVYLYFVNYAATLMTESFYIAAILLSVSLGIYVAKHIRMSTQKTTNRRSTRLLGYGLLLGLCMAIAVLLRQVVAFYFVFLLVWIIGYGLRQRKFRIALGTAAAAGIVVLILVAPVLARNYRVFERLTSTNTNAGFAFFWANHPVYGTDFQAVLRDASYQDLIPVEYRGLNEAELERALMSRGLEYVVDEPVRYLKLSLSRIPIYFLFWPTPESTLANNAARVLSFALVLPFAVYGLGLLFWMAVKSVTGLQQSEEREKGNGDTRVVFAFAVPLVGFVAIYALIHILSWANVRYRLPVDAFLIVFAAFGIDDLGRRTVKASRRGLIEP